MGKPLIIGETDFTVGFADPMFPIRCATVVELRKISPFFLKYKVVYKKWLFCLMVYKIWILLLQTLLLQSMHKYQPRFHVSVRTTAGSDVSVSHCYVKTFEFVETQFIAVTAYQNHRVWTHTNTLIAITNLPTVRLVMLILLYTLMQLISSAIAYMTLQRSRFYQRVTPAWMCVFNSFFFAVSWKVN